MQKESHVGKNENVRAGWLLGILVPIGVPALLFFLAIQTAFLAWVYGGDAPSTAPVPITSQIIVFFPIVLGFLLSVLIFCIPIGLFWKTKDRAKHICLYILFVLLAFGSEYAIYRVMNRVMNAPLPMKTQAYSLLGRWETTYAGEKYVLEFSEESREHRTIGSYNINTVSLFSYGSNVPIDVRPYKAPDRVPESTDFYIFFEATGNDYTKAKPRPSIFRLNSNDYEFEGPDIIRLRLSADKNNPEDLVILLTRVK